MKKTQACLLLAGDSLIEYGDWSALLPMFSVANRGRAGETAQELLPRARRLTSSIATPPAGVLVMIGTNNLAMDDLHFLAEYGEILGVFRKAFPAARLVANGLPPVSFPWQAVSTVPRLNAALARVAEREGADFLDIHAAFVNEAGAPDIALFADDGVHLSEEGYRAWAGLIRRAFADQG